MELGHQNEAWELLKSVLPPITQRGLESVRLQSMYGLHSACTRSGNEPKCFDRIGDIANKLRWQQYLFIADIYIDGKRHTIESKIEAKQWDPERMRTGAGGGQIDVIVPRGTNSIRFNAFRHGLSINRTAHSSYTFAWLMSSANCLLMYLLSAH